MCGIFGFTGAPNEQALYKMSSAIIHRGPDERGYLTRNNASIGICRLAIVDIKNGKQPISNEKEDTWVAFNGEIYNHVSIRNKLEDKGHHFKTSHSDTEVIVHAYEEYGEYWPEKTAANGMFGLAIWNDKDCTLLLYRDRAGKKPLYYFSMDGNIVFASEIKALLEHPDVSIDLDYQSILHYLMFKHVSAPRTAYKKIKQLLPGQYLVWQKGKPLKISRYHSISFTPLRENTFCDTNIANQLFNLIDDAVYLRMQCDVDYGAYLSGGLDSSAVTALMCRHQSSPVKTFSLGYADEIKGQFEGKAQDLHYARVMSKRLGTDHYELIISADDFANSITEVLSAFDEPFSGTISTYFLSTLIKKHVKVALSGDGADELFGSYLAHRIAFPMTLWLEIKKKGKFRWDDLSTEERESLRPFHTKDSFSFLAQLAHSNQAHWREKLAVFTPIDIMMLVNPEVLSTANAADVFNGWHKITSDLTANDALNLVLEADQRDLLPNQVLPFVDRLSMAHSVEVRCPYLDHRIIALANSLSGDLKIRNGVTKYILKKALGKLLPEKLVNRPKEGFVQPIYSWMHGSLKNWILEKLSELPKQLFQQGFLDQLILRFLQDDRKMDAKIWNLTCFSIWLRDKII